MLKEILQDNTPSHSKTEIGNIWRFGVDQALLPKS